MPLYLINIFNSISTDTLHREWEKLMIKAAILHQLPRTGGQLTAFKPEEQSYRMNVKQHEASHCEKLLYELGGSTHWR